jgi:hypothetical protein
MEGQGVDTKLQSWASVGIEFMAIFDREPIQAVQSLKEELVSDQTARTRS